MQCGGKFSYYNYLSPDFPFCSNFNISRKDSAAISKITVVSFNIKFSKNIDLAIAQIRAEGLENADFFLLQEMDHPGVKRIADELIYNYIYYPAAIHSRHGKNFGNAILSKWDICEHQKIILPHKDPDQLRRIAVRATVKVGSRKVDVYSVHLGTLTTSLIWTKKRVEQVQTIMENVKKKSPRYCVIGGDLNTLFPRHEGRVRNVFINNGFKHSSRSITWTVKKFYLFEITLDHIFDKGFKARKSYRASSNNKASDHWLIYSELTF